MAERGLPDRFVALLRAAGGRARADVGRAVAGRVLAGWSEPWRRYHDLGHLTAALAAADVVLAELGDAGVAVDAPAVELAVWFHDVVYDPTAPPGESEAASAERARSELVACGVDADRADRVADLVLVTVDHRPAPGDVEAAAVVDADLSALAVAPAAYDEASRAVRAEYAQVDDAGWALGRSAVIDRLLAAPRLFHSPVPVAQRWEHAARANLQRERARYDVPSPAPRPGRGP